MAAHAFLREDVASDPRRLETCTVAAHLRAYEALLHEKGYLDYSGILKEAKRHLACNEGLRACLKARVRHIVDEYQDVNPVQEAVVRMLYELGATVCVIGVDDQTLYQWRGSDVGNSLTFADRYPLVHCIQFEESFRSSEGMVSLAREFNKKVEQCLPKETKAATAQEYEPGDIVALRFDLPQEEAAYLTETRVYSSRWYSSRNSCATVSQWQAASTAAR